LLEKTENPSYRAAPSHFFAILNHFVIAVAITLDRLRKRHLVAASAPLPGAPIADTKGVDSNGAHRFKRRKLDAVSIKTGAAQPADNRLSLRARICDSVSRVFHRIFFYTKLIADFFAKSPDLFSGMAATIGIICINQSTPRVVLRPF
jgi:hypothetical protein